MIDLRRDQAPIPKAAWEEIDAEAKRVLALNLAARKLVDFEGPLGWGFSSVNLGRVEDAGSPADGVEAKKRVVRPLVELRAPFELSRSEMEDVDRGAKDASLDPVTDAAKRIARAEDAAIFQGYSDAGIEGIGEVSPHEARKISEDYQAYPATVSEALEMLRQAGIDGPYAIALGPRCYSGLMRATAPGGYPVYQHVRKLVDDRVVWAPAVDGAVVMSCAGGDYELTVGQDLSIGYLGHDESKIRLYLVESFTFRVLTPEAAVTLFYADSKGGSRGDKRGR